MWVDRTKQETLSQEVIASSTLWLLIIVYTLCFNFLFNAIRFLDSYGYFFSEVYGMNRVLFLAPRRGFSLKRNLRLIFPILTYTKDEILQFGIYSFWINQRTISYIFTIKFYERKLYISHTLGFLCSNQGEPFSWQNISVYFSLFLETTFCCSIDSSRAK